MDGKEEIEQQICIAPMISPQLFKLHHFHGQLTARWSDDDDDGLRAITNR
jgi:hypothetical protein